MQRVVIALLLLVGIVALPALVMAANVTLAWENPTTNEDGSPLTDLAEMFVHVGTSPGQYATTIPVGLATSHQVTELDAGVAYVFAVTAADTAGNVSQYSNEVSATPDESQIELVLSPSADTFLNLDSTNYSIEPILATYTWPDFKIANAIILKFNLSSIPSGAIIQEAVLHLHLLESDGNGGTYRISAHRLLKNPNISQATGYRYTSNKRWKANACCYNNIPMAQADIASAQGSADVDEVPGEKVWDLTAIVQHWYTAGQNYGVLLNSDATQLKDRYRTFASKDHPTANLRPSLVITYTIP
jgi:hypothetical protein